MSRRCVLKYEIREKKPVHVLRTTARRPLADETPQGRAVGTRRPQLCAATQLALRGQERALTKKNENEWPKNRIKLVIKINTQQSQGSLKSVASERPTASAA